MAYKSVTFCHADPPPSYDVGRVVENDIYVPSSGECAAIAAALNLPLDDIFERLYKALNGKDIGLWAETLMEAALSA